MGSPYELNDSPDAFKVRYPHHSSNHAFPLHWTAHAGTAEALKRMHGAPALDAPVEDAGRGAVVALPLPLQIGRAHV